MKIFFTLCFLSTCFLTVVLSNSVSKEQGHHIKIEIDNYPDSMVVVGYYYGEQTLIYDTLTQISKGNFLLEGNEPLNPGVYLFVTQPDNKFVQFLVPVGDQQFELKTDLEDLSSVQIKDSYDNQLFYEYMDYLKARRQDVDAINAKYGEIEESGKEVEEKNAELKALEQSVKKYQWDLVHQNPETLTALLIKANIQMDVPEFEGTEEEIKMKNYLYYREHYFDHVEFSNPISLYTPFFHQKIDYFITKLTVQTPDSLNESVRYMLGKLENNEEAFKYYLSFFLNKYAKSKVVGQDAVYVFVVENYYAKGMAPWVDDENLEKIIDNATRLKPTLIGQQAPEFTVYLENGDPVSLKNIESPFTLLIFWKPDCGHCTKAMPVIVDFYKKFKDRGVKLITICTKTGDSYNTCWESLEEKGMLDFINTGDQYQKSRIQALYYVRSTPKIFILDRDKKIIMKGIGAEQLEGVMEELIRIDMNMRTKEVDNK